MKPIKSRDNSLDIARGIAILGVLYGHAMAWQYIHGTAFTSWFWSFHMALFALVSGYFYKEKPFWITFVSSVKSLLFPLFIVSFVCFFIYKCGGNWLSICYDFLIRVYATLTLRVDPPGFWFVIALFNCRMILALVSKLNFKYKYLLLAVLSLFVFFFPIHIDQFQFSRTFGLMAFVVIGMYAKRFDLLNRPVNKAFAVLLAIILLSAGLFSVDIWGYNLPLYLLNFLTASVISYALVFYCKQIDKSENSLLLHFNSVLAFCGRHSLMVLSFQAVLGPRFVRNVPHYFAIQNEYIIMLIFVFICLISTLVLTELRIQLSKLLS